MADSAAGEHEDHDHDRETSFVESLKDKVTETFHRDDSSSSDSEDKGKKSLPVSPVKDNVYCLFGREKPVHEILGGGKSADILLWRHKKTSAGMLGFATLIWVLFELIEYHLLSLLCHTLILVLAVLFLWSNTFNVIYKCPQLPKDPLQDDTVLHVASVLRVEINKALVVLREIASGRDLKKFLAVIAGLWILSIAGSCCNLLTLLYICFVLLHTVPLLYERHKDKVDVFLDKAKAECEKHYKVFNAKVLSKVPRGSFKEKKLT